MDNYDKSYTAYSEAFNNIKVKENENILVLFFCKTCARSKY